jgi:hypothetical protein
VIVNYTNRRVNMAKCIKMLEGDGKLIRVPDNVAGELVDNGRAEYINKKDWKDSGRKQVKDIRRINYGS